MKQFKTDQEYYNDWEYISNSQLGYLKKGWEYYEMMQQGEKIDSPALRFGNLVHTLILEPKEYQNKFTVFNSKDRPEPNKTMSSKLNRAWKKKIDECCLERDKVLLTLDQYNLGLTLRDKLTSVKDVKDILDNSNKEVSKSWIDFNTMVKCKGKADLVVNGGDMLVDIKTTSKPVTEFAKSAYRYDYHRQAAFYLDGFNSKEFMFVVIETTPPYQIGIFRCTENFIDQGREEYIRLLDFYKQPKKNINKIIFDEL
jgi:hypothetical protein